MTRVYSKYIRIMCVELFLPAQSRLRSAHRCSVYHVTTLIKLLNRYPSIKMPKKHCCIFCSGCRHFAVRANGAPYNISVAIINHLLFTLCYSIKINQCYNVAQFIRNVNRYFRIFYDGRDVIGSHGLLCRVRLLFICLLND